MAQKPVPEAESLRRQQALDAHSGNITRAAEALGDVARTTLQHWKSERDRAAKGYKVKGTSTLYDAEGNTVLEWVKTREDSPSPDEIADQVRAAIDGFTPPTNLPASPQHTEADLATVYPCADWHVGLLTWAKEVGVNYDLKIAQKTIRDAVTRLVSITPASSQAVVLGLGDLLHADNYTNRTSASGAYLDVDGRYPRVLQAAVDLMLLMIGLALIKHGQVLVRILPGNHDDVSAIAVALALSMFYQNEPRVTVDTDASRFWWWSWGKAFLGATHGDKAKMADLPLIMASRNPEQWGKAKFRHIFTGHIHRDTAIEKNGTIVESMRAPVPSDSWHHAMGYGAGRTMQAITFSKDHGEIARQKVHIL
jgi:hypothetical protein